MATKADRYGAAWTAEAPTEFVTCNICGAAIRNTSEDTQLHFDYHPEKGQET